MIRATNNTLVCRPRPDIHGRIVKWVTSGETVDSAVFGEVKIDNTVSYRVTSLANNFAFGEVLSVGRGAAWMSDKYRLDVEGPSGNKPGTIIGFDLCQVSHSFLHDGETQYFLPINAALCRFDPGADMPQPLGVYFMTRHEPEAAIRFQKRDKKSGLWLPSAAGRGSIKTSDAEWSRVNVDVERIVSVGGGGMGLSEKCKKPVEVIPDPSAIGHLCVFMSTLSVDLPAYGEMYKFTNWERLRGVVEDDVDESLKVAS